MIRLLLDSGGRLSEITTLPLESLNLSRDLVTVRGKGDRQRTIPFGERSGQVLTRYLRARTRHAGADLPDLFLATRGRAALKPNGVNNPPHRTTANLVSVLADPQRSQVVTSSNAEHQPPIAGARCPADAVETVDDDQLPPVGSIRAVDEEDRRVRVLENLRVALEVSLRGVGFGVDLADADEALSVNAYDGVVFDRMLPSGDSLDYLEQRRRTGWAVPVLFLTARDAVTDRIAGLTWGDDYLVKPFAMAELVA
ncbi:response regulator [Amycolatopsis sp.]|uniref:response regulator n=1 Tax=Amycolatopsis sp. TaxID=37632 RepID=UPI00345A25E5